MTVSKSARRAVSIPVVLLATMVSGGVSLAPVQVPAVAAAQATAVTDPTRLASIPASTSQVIVVTSRSWGSSRAKLHVWQRVSRTAEPATAAGPSATSDSPASTTPSSPAANSSAASGSWQLLEVADARVGRNGMAPAARRRQNTSTTPSGTFALGTAFGIAPAPVGTTIAYRRVTSADYWVYDPRDPASYNRWVVGRAGASWRTSWAEHLIGYGRQYRHGVVIDFNHAASAGQPDVRAGGGIFLHVVGPGATAGCVAVSAAQMARILRWLRPGTAARIVIAPQSQLTRM